MLIKKKLKLKDEGKTLPALTLSENPDILATLSKKRKNRPGLVIGFAAETHDLEELATAKMKRKGCDWIVANDVSRENGIMGGSENAVTFITEDGSESWPRVGKAQVAGELADRMAQYLATDRDA